jgi:hypothetical protein
MFDDDTLVKARRELQRINSALHDLHKEEERAKITRSRLEDEKVHIKALVDMCELAQRLAQKPLEQIGPAYHIENHQGARFVVADKPAVSPGTPHLNGTPVVLTAPAPAAGKHKIKPDGLPSMTAMVATVVSGSSKGLTSGEIIIAIRAKWWSDVAAVRVYAIVSSMLKHGKLQRKRNRYFTILPRLTMPADEATVSA